MSTIKTTFIQHPSATEPAIELEADGTVLVPGLEIPEPDLTNLDADNLTSGTVPTARVSGSYTDITGTGALDAGSVTSGFGNVDIGASTFTGNGSGLTTLNASNLSSGTLATARMAAGTILQVVQTVKKDTFTSASTSYVNVTGLSATITPRSTASKILILAQISGSSNGGSGHAAGFRITGGNATTFVGNAAGSRTRAVYSLTASNTTSTMIGQISFLDAPATASAVTYQVQLICGGGAQTAYVNLNQTDTDLAIRYRGASSIILFEVAG